MNSFPDLHHLQRLRTDLWKSPGYGQAAVMVGSGFSLNAEPVPGQRKTFPLWRNLAEEMFDRLYPVAADDKDRLNRRLQAVAGLGGISLASEYEAAFGRQGLDQLVLESIPEDRYLPSELHRLLLQLPWSDVFTTNYDTLLERTIVDERYYQLILSAEDLPGSAHPRIIKLHGSFPSQRPFILTREDYRTFPRRFAPFVNTVQQALMENTLVLLGFSGDDPNFLYWSGWVRDELGANAPRMYLCGVLNLTDPQKRLLEQRGVIPIDLSPVIANTGLPPGRSRHAVASEWLLLSLKNGRPSNFLRWPSSQRAPVSQPNYLPPLLPQPLPDSPEAPLFPDPGIPVVNQIPNLLKAWCIARETYPGWIVTPHENRDQVWEQTQHWLNPLLDQSLDLDPEIKVLILFELNWRLERVLLSLFLGWVRVIEHALDAVDIENYRDTPLPPYLEEAWIDLAFAVTREAREDFDAERHDRWLNRILPIAKRRPEWFARWHYENCLHALWRLDQRELRSRLDQWRPSSDLLVWQIRRASLLAEIGELAEAERIASDVLRRIRTGLLGRRPQVELWSLEGWAMRLLGVVRGFRLMSDAEEWERFRDRWLQLASSRCDPWRETDALSLPLQNPAPRITPAEEKKRDFDYQVIYTQHIARDNLTPVIPAFALLRLYEEAGLPMKAGRFTQSGDQVVNACRWIMSAAPLWATATLVRIGKKEPLRDAFARVRVAMLTPTEVETMRSWLIPAIAAAMALLPVTPAKNDESFSERVIEELVDLLSRLCIRMSPPQLEEVFRLAIQLYLHPGVRFHVGLHDVCKPFFRRLFDAAESEQVCSWIPQLLTLPILSAEDATKNVWQGHGWPDPFDDINADTLQKCSKSLADDSAVARRIAELLRNVQFEEGAPRERAVQRLWILFQAELLTPQQRSEFGKALWAQIHPETGLPNGTKFLHLHF